MSNSSLYAARQWKEVCNGAKNVERKFQSSTILPFSFINMLLVLQCVSVWHTWLLASAHYKIKLFILISFYEFISDYFFQLHFLFVLNAQQLTVGNNFIIIIFHFFNTFIVKRRQRRVRVSCQKRKMKKVSKTRKNQCYCHFLWSSCLTPLD
jgi:hypothetical protein